jgi:putative membrane protein
MVGAASFGVASAGPGVGGTIALPLLVACYWIPYWRRCRTLGVEGRPVPRWRMVSFAAGLIVFAAALGPPLDRWAQQLLIAHMVEHLLIGDVASLLLVLGLTGPVLQPLLRIKLIDRLRVLLHPVVAVALWAVDLYVWHLPVMYQAALRHDAIHVLEHACFLFFGSLIWMALLGPLPKPAWFGNLAKLGYIVVVRLVGTLLGNIFIWSGTVFYPFYTSGDAHWHIAPLNDQSVAGAVMMLEESILTIGLFAWLFLKAARESEERQELLELAAARGVALTEERAGRAVAAGRGEQLRERILGQATTTGV